MRKKFYLKNGNKSQNKKEQNFDLIFSYSSAALLSYKELYQQRAETKGILKQFQLCLLWDWVTVKSNTKAEEISFLSSENSPKMK